MSDPNSLVATRARRANAGSRLKHLIEIEELASETRSFAMTEDDENVELLFQEDDNDEEFNEGDEDDQDQEEEESDEEEEEASGPVDTSKNDTAKTDTTSPSKEDSVSETEENVNADDMLSDSDLSVSDSDDSEGERELEKQERANKRKKKSQPFVPAIKKPKPEIEKAKPVAKPLVKHSDILLMSERRSSSRKSALKNKEQLINRIRQDEKRRAAHTPIKRVKERKLTQEERLAQAVETERENIESLHLFMEQEIVKKERQKWLLQLRRAKLKNVIRFTSEETFVCPLDEIEDERHVQDMYERRRKGRRRRFNEYPEERRYGDIDPNLPYYRREMEEKRIRELKMAEERRILEEQRAIKRKRLEEEREARRKALEEEREARKIAKEERLKEFEDVDVTENHIADTSTDLKEALDQTQLKNDEEASAESIAQPLAQDETNMVKESDDKVEASQDIESTSQEAVPEVKIESSVEKTQNDDSSDINKPDEVPGTNVDSQPDSMDIDTKPIQDQMPAEPAQIENEEAAPTESRSLTEQPSQSGETPGSTQVLQAATPVTDRSKEPTAEPEKKVTFEVAEKVENEEEAGGLITQESLNEYFYRRSENGSIYEGPVQHVGRNHVILMDFEEEQRWGLTEMRIQQVLFGDDATFSGSRRLRDVETILRSTTRLDNPYAITKEDTDNEILKSVKDIKEEDPMFEVLRRIPRLGDKNIVTEEVYEELPEESTHIRIRTEAPTGLYLPNGNKKLCLISGKEVRYFDPITGMPYENKDMYKIIKDVEMGLYSWHSIGRDVNAYGMAQVYLNKREGARHAKGVPEGFDG
ncbi:hypothetical protein PUMCH_004464 [Australozyma saopauloensis]|uniref:Vps72/YL1 C-terminal domain-containing protein n=1 Tax=Australozyma saopauloensis TaxID=291208 RepID=A0AAX4HFB2_9ASCO|nr:hypothetical protein PUMCH_004464 [[Candida] saopauloensis]